MMKVMRYWIALLFYFGLAAQTEKVLNWHPDETAIRNAMHEEILRRIEQKAVSEKKGENSLFDFNTNRAYERIKSRLREQLNNNADLFSYLEKLYKSASEDADIGLFRQEVDGFVLGMSIEMKDTLLDEYYELQEFFFGLIKLKNELASPQPLTLEEVEEIIQKWKLPRFLLKRLEGADLGPRKTSSESSFDRFAVAKAHIMGKPPNAGQKQMYDLGDRYRERYPFMDDFLENTRRLLELYRSLAAEIREGFLRHGI